MPGEEKSWWEKYLEKRRNRESREKEDEGGVILTEQEAQAEGLFD